MRIDMKKMILTILFYFSLTIVGLANNNAIYHNNLAACMAEQYNVDLDDIEKYDGLDIESIDVIIEDISCTVTITGSIGVGGTGISVSISVTEETCGEAIEEAIASYQEIRSQLMELL